MWVCFPRRKEGKEENVWVEEEEVMTLEVGQIAPALEMGVERFGEKLHINALVEVS
jgi:hypothetical protein